MTALNFFSFELAPNGIPEGLAALTFLNNRKIMRLLLYLSFKIMKLFLYYPFKIMRLFYCMYSIKLYELKEM